MALRSDAVKRYTPNRAAIDPMKASARIWPYTGQPGKVGRLDQALSSQDRIPPAAPATATNKNSLMSNELMRSPAARVPVAGAVPIVHLQSGALCYAWR